MIPPDPKVTPGLWCQTFIISAEVSSGIFVPVCFCLLPDKKKESYETMFSLLKEALETLGKELSAAYFMSDFELAIRNAFTGTFQGIELKDSLNKAETVLKMEGIKAGLATAAPKDQKELLGERLFPQIQRMNSELAGKLTGMMLEKSNEKILQMIENPDYLTEEVKAAQDYLKK